MVTQYQLLNQMLKSLKLSKFGLVRMSRIECLIYQLKLLLLTCERLGRFPELDGLCPAKVLEHLLHLLEPGDDGVVADQLLRQVEEGLQGMIGEMSARLTPKAAGGDYEQRPCAN